MSIQFDSKSILIIFFLGLSLFFGYKWYFTTGNKKEYKEKVEKLQMDNKKIREVRDSLQTAFFDMQKQYQVIVEKDSLLRKEVIHLRQETIDLKNRAERTVNELKRLRIDLERVNKKIRELENNPPNKTDHELIESLKNKLK